MGNILLNSHSGNKKLQLTLEDTFKQMENQSTVYQDKEIAVKVVCRRKSILTNPYI